MERFDKETESKWCVCASVSESRKEQFRTKSVTHNLRGPEMVPLLFATCHVDNTHTYFISVCCSFSDCAVKQSNNTKPNAAETTVVERKYCYTIHYI